MTELVETSYTIDRWYDPHTKCWVVQVKDTDNNQVGEAIHVHTKREAKHIEISDFAFTINGQLNEM